MDLIIKENSPSWGQSTLKKSGHGHGLGLKLGNKHRLGSEHGHGLGSERGLAQKHTRGMTLDLLKPGEKARILTVGGEQALRRHLLDMGLTPKTLIMVRKVAPLGDPIELYLRNFELTLRKEDARHIGIEAVME